MDIDTITPVIDHIEDIKPFTVSDLVEIVEKYGACYLRSNEMVFDIDYNFLSNESKYDYDHTDEDYELDNISKQIKGMLRDEKINSILKNKNK
jgi:hypothetical protein